MPIRRSPNGLQRCLGPHRPPPASGLWLAICPSLRMNPDRSQMIRKADCLLRPLMNPVLAPLIVPRRFAINYPVSRGESLHTGSPEAQGFALPLHGAQCRHPLSRVPAFPAATPGAPRPAPLRHGRPCARV